MIATVRSGLARLRDRPGAPLQLPAATVRSLALFVVLAIGITALVMMFLWHDQSTYKPVFGSHEKVVAADMMAVLDAEHIAYRLHPDTGQVLVPEAMLGKVRMLLAARGVTARLPAGLELMDRNDPLGVSQFVQDVRFRRGLEGELAQSIAALDAIESARVHLSIAKSTSFVASDGEKSSAAVVVALKQGRTLAPEQIAAIVSLVAGSVASLEPQRVSLVDQAGNLLSSHIDLTDGFDAGTAGDNTRRYEDDARRNVTELLAPVLGADNFKVSATAAVDNDRVEETLEKFGENPKVTSEATREEQDRNRLALGVPGSLSNRPVEVASASSAPDDGGNAHKNATTRQFTYDRSVTQIKHSRGRLSRMNVAVVLNAAAAPTPASGWTKDELANVERILRNGLGLDAARGDSLVVSTLRFPAPAAAPPWWKERDNVVEIGSWAVYGVVAILAFFFILRPATRLVRTGLSSLPAPTRDAVVQPAALPGTASLPSAPALAGAATAEMPVVPLLENYDLPPPGSPVDVMVEHLKVLAGKEPERVAEVVKQWVQKHGRTPQ